MSQVGTLVSFTEATTIVNADIDQNFADIKAAVNTCVFTDVTNVITTAQRLANNIAINGRNAADSGNIEILKLNASDLIEMSGAALRTGPHAPITNGNLDTGTTSLRWGTIWGTKLVLTTQTPASAAASGTAGEIAWDTGFLYVCTATNTWERVAVATW